MHKYTLSIILLALFLTPQSILSQTDIVGGEDAEIQDYPYQAALLNTGGWGGGYAFCGASIINEYWILTAAHCLEGESATNLSVRVGNDASYAQGGESYDAAEIIIHENYNDVSNGNDIALIRLDNPISFDNYTQPVVLICDQQVSLGVEEPGEMSWITGWGEDEGTANNPNQLQVVGVPITTQSNYGGISNDMIMAGYPEGGYDSCQGDSGGPMVVYAADGMTYLQVGVVSWGSGCAEPNYPGVYARVSYFIDWICNNTNGAVCPNESIFCNDDAVYGCTDTTAENYNSDATLNDGSCLYPCDNNVQFSIQLDCYGEEISWEIVNENGIIVAQVMPDTYPGGSSSDTMEEGGSLQEQDICLSTGCYTFTITDSYGDGLAGSQWTCTVNGAPFSMTDQDNQILFEENDPTFGDCEELGDEALYDGSCSQSYSFCISIGDPIYGCTDGSADNYNSEANTDNGSCIYYGCTDSNYIEFDNNATNDDGSCETLIVIGCTDPQADNYNLEANTSDESCEYKEGCTDPQADNYDSEAIIDDGSCEYSYVWEQCSDIIWFEDFENYNTGNIDSQTNEWIGWDNTNSGADISPNGFFNSSQSILIEQDDDLIHIVEPLVNSGEGEIIFYMLIPSGESGAYYNMLHNYDGTNSNWAFQVLFASQNSGDQSFVDLENPIYFDALYDTWVEVRHEINIDNDIINLYYNSDLIASWTWSNGSTESSNSLDALNFYGFCTGTGCVGEAWYDNIEICGFEDNSTDINTIDIISYNIYPNPNNGEFHLTIDTNVKEFNVEVYDISGKRVYNDKIENYQSGDKYKISNHLSTGSYILHINSQHETHKELIIIE